MTLPENEWEHLQDQVRQYHNKLVKAYFKSTPDNDIGTIKGSLKHACVMKDGDTASMLIERQLLFYMVVGKARALHPPIYGIPVQDYQRDTKFSPQVKLYFVEPYDKETHDTLDFTPVTGQISFRIPGETSQSYTETKAAALANQIYQEFAQPVFTWKKGWYKYTYLDLAKGYDLRLFVSSKTEGQRVATAVLDCQGDIFDSDNAQFIEHDKSYPAIPGNQTVYGKSTRKPRQRPRTDIKFTHAQLFIHGRQNAVNLVAHKLSYKKNVIKYFDGA